MFSAGKSSNHTLNNKEQLISAIKKEFDLQTYAEFHKLFPFCNEYGFAEIIKILVRYKVDKSQKETVSLVFGESNFLSLLPALSHFSDIVLLADVNPLLHRHRQFLLNCFMASSNPEEFESKYFVQGNPAIGQHRPSNESWEFDPCFYLSDLRENLNFTKASVGKHHFLHSQESFDNCKIALAKMTLLPIHFNVFDQPSCIQLNSLLHQYNAELNFCNFTNISEYDENFIMKNNVKRLLKGCENAFIIFSSRDRKVNNDGFPRTIMNLGLEHYSSTDINKAYTQFGKYTKHMYSVNQMLSKTYGNSMLNNHFSLKQPLIQKSKKSYENCYIAIYSCDRNQMKNIIDGTLDINSFPVTPAFDSQYEMKQGIVDFKNKHSEEIKSGKINLNNGWIASFWNNKQKINKYIWPAEYSGNNVRIKNHLKLSSYIIKATKVDEDMEIEKSPDRIPHKYIQETINPSPTQIPVKQPLINNSVKVKLITNAAQPQISGNSTNSAKPPIAIPANKPCILANSKISFFSGGCNQVGPSILIERQDEVRGQVNLVNERIRQFSHTS